jgi:hypothetical protein
MVKSARSKSASGGIQRLQVSKGWKRLGQGLGGFLGNIGSGLKKQPEDILANGWSTW